MTTKTTKYYALIALIAAGLVSIIIPMTMIDAQAAEGIEKTIIKTTERHTDIPLFNERQVLFKQYDSTTNEIQKTAIQTQLNTMNALIQSWYDSNMDQSKYNLAREKQSLLNQELQKLRKDLGNEEGWKKLPYVVLGYDYVDNALDVRIDSKQFTKENIPKYTKLIRSIVGNEVNLVLGPGELEKPIACTSRTASECEPIKGGVEVEIDNASICSVMFKATYNSKTGFPTAGHCFIDSSGNNRTGTTIQQPSSSSTDIGNKELVTINKGGTTTCDCAFVSELSASRSMSDQVYDLSDPAATATPFVNMNISMSGRTSGVLSGTVTDVDADICYDLDGSGSCETFVDNTNDASFSPQGGDSGSPIMSGNSLVGMTITASGKFIDTAEIQSAFSGLTWGF